MTTPVPVFNYSQAVGGSSTGSFITIIEGRAPTGNDGPQQRLQVTQRWIDTSDDNSEYFLLGFIASAGVVQANWVKLNQGTATLTQLSGNAGVATSVAGNINVVGDASGIQTSATSDTLTATLSNIPNSSLLHSDITLVAGTGISITTSPVSLGGSTTISATGTGLVTTLTGNSGGAIGPTGGNINVVGDGTTIAIAGNPATNTLTVSAIPGSPDFSSIAIQTFTTTATYTPTVNMKYCIIELCGGGGGGGGAANAETSNGAGGSGGGYSRGVFSAATIGGSQSVNIGGGGMGGGAGPPSGNGTSGGTTSVGALISATGGAGGGGGVGPNPGEAGAPGIGSGGSVNLSGNYGGDGFVTSGPQLFSGYGGSSLFGGGVRGVFANNAGFNGLSYGSGGSGAAGSPGSFSGGNGSPGVVIVTEFIS